MCWQPAPRMSIKINRMAYEEKKKKNILVVKPVHDQLLHRFKRIVEFCR